MGFFDKLKKITSNLFSGFTEADEDFFEELEETLIMADLGVDAATDAVEKLRTKVRKEHLQGQEEVREALREILMAEMEVGNTALKLDTKPSVCIFIGVNGVGKTTSIGKIAASLKKQGKRVMRRRYLPRRRRRPVGDLGRAGRMRDRPAVRGRGPRRRTVRRTSGC
jgi:fused signal recognition particle receptor